jgi:uncharacterized membrane protein
MEDREKAIRELHEQIQKLAAQQKDVQQQILKLQNAVFELNIAENADLRTSKATPVQKVEVKEPPKVVTAPPQPTPREKVETFVSQQKEAVKKKSRAPIEEFIGTNLLNKIGIAVLVIGIAFGAKYSIDHNLINPLTRIILGYIAGAALIAIAIRLKEKHANFSAVLLSGGMAVLYFITYAAYDFYQLIPQAMAFALMVAFTGFTVFAALQYNLQAIGIIGLVGAYAVPFLLSDGSGKVHILFSYITIINIGILILAFKKEWKGLYYLGFGLTWLSYSAWFGTSYDEKIHLWLGLSFSTIFFLTFFTTFLAYKLLRSEPLKPLDIGLTLANSFIYYGFGYSAIELLEGGDSYLGIFTVFTAVLHFVAFVIIYKNQEKLRDTFYFVAGLVLTFLTLAVPVQLEGNWVTLIWALEACLLFWIGRTKKFPAYEILSYPLILLAIVSLVHDWSESYPAYFYSLEDLPTFNLFLNIQFVTSLIVAGAIGFVIWLNSKVAHSGRNFLNQVPLNYAMPTLLLFILYFAFYKEIQTFWIHQYAASRVNVKTDYGDIYPYYDEDMRSFGKLWLINYSAIFALILSLIQIRFVKNDVLMKACVIFNTLVIATFVTMGLYEASSLRFSYLTDYYGEYYIRNSGNIIIRYISIGFIAPLMYLNYWFLKQPNVPATARQTERIAFHLAVLILLSSELIHWLDIADVQNSYKLALSILWGAYALFLIVLGLWKNYKYIRVSAIVLFAVTLIKLFLYDMQDMSTIAKTIVMIILGALLLIASFLYNKYKNSTGDETA